MAAPIVTYYNAEGTQQVTQWNVGEVDAQDTSAEFKVTIWNNKGGQEPVATMKRVKINVLTDTGSDTGDELVEKNWVEVKINSESNFTQIGGKKLHGVYAKGVTDPAAEGYIIGGAANGGAVNTDINNYAEAAFQLHVPLDASEGQHNFRIRTTYFYT